MNRGKVGEERGGKETDRYPLTGIDLGHAICGPKYLSRVLAKPIYNFTIFGYK
jgi:hypothetical protein